MYRTTDPDTSVEAAHSINTARLEALVLCWLRDRGEVGGTAEEISDGLAIALNTISPRTAPLVHKGLIYASPLRRRGRSGRSKIVWIATPPFILD